MVSLIEAMLGMASLAVLLDMSLAAGRRRWADAWCAEDTPQHDTGGLELMGWEWEQ